MYLTVLILSLAGTSLIAGISHIRSVLSLSHKRIFCGTREVHFGKESDFFFHRRRIITV